MHNLVFSCTLGLDQDACGKHCLDPISPHQQSGGCPSCVNRTKDVAPQHTDLDLELVQKYVQYMELYEAQLTQPLRPIEQHALDRDQAELLCSIQPYGESISFLESLVALTSYSPPQDHPATRYPNHKELCMAIALWMLDHPSP